jgi:hypothetical protein
MKSTLSKPLKLRQKQFDIIPDPRKGVWNELIGPSSKPLEVWPALNEGKGVAEPPLPVPLP